MRSKSRTFSIYVVLIVFSVLVVLNPAVVSLYLNLQMMPAIYLLVFDFAVASIGVLCILYLKTRRRAYVITSVIGILFLPFLMGLTELTLTYVRLAYGFKWNGIEFQNVHEANPVLGWRPIPNTKGRHRFRGNFDVLYNIDEKGRKAIPQNKGAKRTVYFFGDSFTFGQGAMNEDTALNLLAERIGDQFNVLNYGVMGYGLEQMLARLRSSLDAIEPGDLIVFSPLSEDILRNLIHRVHLCQLILTKGSVSGGSVQSVPVFRNGRWDIIQIREECGLLESLILTSYAMPIGILYRWYRDMKFGDTLLDHADQILTEAARLGQQRGGHFVLVFLVTPAECERQAFAVDVHRLKMAFVSLMPFCPEDPETLKSLRFPNDPHWSPEGNRWAARALEQVLRARLAVFQ